GAGPGRGRPPLAGELVRAGVAPVPAPRLADVVSAPARLVAAGAGRGGPGRPLGRAMAGCPPGRRRRQPGGLAGLLARGTLPASRSYPGAGRRPAARSLPGPRFCLAAVLLPGAALRPASCELRQGLAGQGRPDTVRQEAPPCVRP